jgi:hypothetical protein
VFIVERNVFLDFHIDTNRINAKSSLKYMNILEHWHENDVIYIEMAEVAQNEAANRGSSLRSEKAYSYIATETLAGTPDEFRMLRQIIEVLFPNGIKSTNEKNDVEIVCNAWKYGRILVTDDGGSKKQPGGILGSRGKLAALGIKVLRDYEAVELVKEKIIQRDQSALKVASYKKDSIPQWVGKDLDVIKTFLKNEKGS